MFILWLFLSVEKEGEEHGCSSLFRHQGFIFANTRLQKAGEIRSSLEEHGRTNFISRANLATQKRSLQHAVWTRINCTSFRLPDQNHLFSTQMLLLLQYIPQNWTFLKKMVWFLLKMIWLSTHHFSRCSFICIHTQAFLIKNLKWAMLEAHIQILVYSPAAGQFI